MGIYQGKKNRYCGYCNENLDDYTMEEFMMHLDICEREKVKYLKRIRDNKDGK